MQQAKRAKLLEGGPSKVTSQRNDACHVDVYLNSNKVGFCTPCRIFVPFFELSKTVLVAGGGVTNAATPHPLSFTAPRADAVAAAGSLSCRQIS